MRCKGKPRPIFLSPREATAMAQRRLDVLIRPVKDGHEFYHIDKEPVEHSSECQFFVIEHNETRGLLDSPYRPGDIVPCKEAWKIFSWHEGEPLGIEYLAGGQAEMRCYDDTLCDLESWYENYWIECGEDMEKAGVKLDDDGEYRWNSPLPLPTRTRHAITLPKGGVRHHRTVKSVECVRVKDVPVLAIEASGIIHLPANRHYATGILEGHDYQTPFKVEWLHRYPAHPFDSAWAFVTTFEEGE